MMTDDDWERFEHPQQKPFHLRGQAARSVRRMVSRAQGYICPICGCELVKGGEKWTIDHVIPKKLGGADHVGNFLMTHYHCNTRKADRPPTGCELIWLLAVNNRIGVQPMKW